MPLGCTRQGALLTRHTNATQISLGNQLWKGVHTRLCLLAPINALLVAADQDLPATMLLTRIPSVPFHPHLAVPGLPLISAESPWSFRGDGTVQSRVILPMGTCSYINDN